jgi:hypothetical protein
LADLAEQGGWMLNCPHDLVAVPVLSAAGGAVGNSCRLQIHEGQTQGAALFLYIVARPGEGKSPAVELLMDPFLAEQGRRFHEWERKHGDWKAREKKGRGTPPKLSHCFVDDTTLEALMVTLADAPRGVLWYKDEIVSLVTAMDQYKAAGRGHDRQIILKLWAGSPIKIDRKSDPDRPTLYIPRPFVAIAGGIQPKIIRRLRGSPGSDDGLFDRFWGSFPQELPVIGEEWRSVSGDAAAAWANAVRSLLSLEMDNGRPRLLTLNRAGKDAWKQFTDLHAAEMNDDLPEYLRGLWHKLRGGCGRIALVLHLLDNACRADAGTPFALEPGEVGAQPVERAAQVVAYLKQHAKKVYAAADMDPRVAVARAILKWAEREGLRTFTRRDAGRAARGTAESTEQAGAGVDLLVEHNFARLVPEEPPGGPEGSPARPTK